MDNPEKHVALNKQDTGENRDNPETHVALKTQDIGKRHRESRDACST
jgi:hypothetical protein